MVDGVVLSRFDQSQEVGDLDAHETGVADQRAQPQGEVNNVGHVSEDVVGHNQIGRTMLLCDPFTRVGAQEEHLGRNTAGYGSGCDVGRRLDPE